MNARTAAFLDASARRHKRRVREELFAWQLGRAYGTYRRALDAIGADREIALQVALEMLLSALTRDRRAKYTRAESFEIARRKAATA